VPAHPDYMPRGGKATTLVQEEMAQQLSGVFGFGYSESYLFRHNLNNHANPQRWERVFTESFRG